MNRKDFLKSFVFAAAGGSVLLAACGGDSGNKENTNSAPEVVEEPVVEEQTAEPMAEADCNDLSGITEADIKQRESVGYVLKSDDPNKNCSNCRFYQPGSQPNGCAGCQLFKGPVAPDANCKSWFKQDA